MAKSKYEYVKQFELSDKCLPNTWLVIRLDGRSFHRFCDAHKFEKPNDGRAIGLMSRCAEEVMKEFSDIVIAYGQSDEYSFVLRPSTTLFGRRASGVQLQYPVTFDGRVVSYPTAQDLRNYLSWRQADCHINNLYNTCFWSLVKQGKTGQEAEERLRGTVSSQKNELLFSECSINYNNEPEIFRKGTTLIWQEVEEEVSVTARPGRPSGAEASEGAVVKRKRKQVTALHCDIIGNAFWENHPQLLQ